MHNLRSPSANGLAQFSAVLLVLAGAIGAQADIFTWEFVDPLDSSRGWQASTTLTPGGAGVNAVPGANLSARDLTKAYLVDTDLTNANIASANLTNAAIRNSNLTNANLTSATLTGAYLHGADLTGAKLNQANLTDAELNYTKLAGADFTNAQVRGARFGIYFLGSELTAAQLYSTASYKAKDLTGISLYYTNLHGWNFAGQNLANANFDSAKLTGADFTDAVVQGAYFGDTTGGGLTAAQLYSTASYKTKDLTGIHLPQKNLTGWNFAGQNLTNARFWEANLSGADFTNAQVQGADFRILLSTPLSMAQLYSTGSYQAHDLSGIRFIQDLSGWNFAGQNLAGTSFNQCTLTGADFTGAQVKGTDFSDTTRRGSSGFLAAQLYSTASYQAKDLTGINLSSNDLRGWNFAGQNLTGASLSPAAYLGQSLDGADFTGAQVQGAEFNAHLSAAQLYSTASYQAKQLAGIHLSGNDLRGWNFAGQNLTGAGFSYATLSGANLAGANLSGASFYHANLTAVDFTGVNHSNADFQGADTRGTVGLSVAATNAPNVIRPDGHIAGLELKRYNSLTVRDYDGDSGALPTGPIPITVDEHFAMDSTGTLNLWLAQGPWDSTIAFAPGIPVALNGQLYLTFADNVPIAPQFGRTFKLFDWTGVSPTGEFQVPSNYNWDLSKLYTTGEVTLLPGPIPGDFNQDGTVDAADYTIWRDRLHDSHYPSEYRDWKVNFGTSFFGAGSASELAARVPEPTSVPLLIFAIAAAASARRQRDSRTAAGFSMGRAASPSYAFR